VPAGADASGPPAPAGGATTPAEAPPAEKPKGNVVASETGQLLVLASTDGMKDRFLVLGQPPHNSPGYQSNLRFFQNAIETFGLGQELMKIRSKTLTQTRFKPSSDDEFWRVFIQVANIGLLPLAVAIIGLVRYLLRRAESSAYERQMAERSSPSI
jgi:hypothetical protein